MAQRSKLTIRIGISAVLCSLTAQSALACNSLASIKAAFSDESFSGIVTTFRGHEFGYNPPAEGDAFSMELGEIESWTQIGFPHQRYVPLPSSLCIIDVENAGNGGAWQSFRAEAEESAHKVTLDVIRNPGSGHPKNTIVRILVESRDRVIGFVEIQGKTDS